MKKQLLAMLVAGTVLALSSCSDYPGYKKTDTGLYYKFFKKNEDSLKPALGDIMTIDIAYRKKGEDKEKDSLLFRSSDNARPAKLQLIAPKYQGDISEGMAMLAIGDSASFIVNADSFYLKNVGLQKLPPNVTPGGKMVIDVKLKSIQKKADYEKEMKLEKDKIAALTEERKAKEPDEIAKFVKDSSIRVKPTKTGLYYIPVKYGTGAYPKNGDTVKVDYVGKLLNGTIFDASTSRGPIKFVLGENKVIPGWEEGLKLMRVGGKAKFLIPSSLAYEDKGAGQVIEPYTPLYFEVTLLAAK